MAQEEITPNLMKGYLEELASKGKRIDGRDFDEFREIKVESGIIGTADGSAMATIGKTKVSAVQAKLSGRKIRLSGRIGTLARTSQKPLKTKLKSASPAGVPADFTWCAS